MGNYQSHIDLSEWFEPSHSPERKTLGHEQKPDALGGPDAELSLLCQARHRQESPNEFGI